MSDSSADQAAESAVFRAEWRREKIAARLSLPAAEHVRASAAIEDQLTTLLAPLSAQTIAFCWPVRREFDCRALISRLLAKGWQACQPVVVDRTAPMQFRAWQPGAAMAADPYGIPVPEAGVVAVPDVVLLPLVGFDEQGYRLGYGGGYFDRTLAILDRPPWTIGIGFEFGRMDSIRPGSHDIRLDVIVTEAAVRRFDQPR